MNNFQVVEIIDATTIRVSPRWKFETKNNVVKGDIVQIRGIDPQGKDAVVINRLKKLLLNKSKLEFNAPELIYTEDNKPIVSCSVYLADSNVVYYFPEFAYKDSDD